MLLAVETARPTRASTDTMRARNASARVLHSRLVVRRMIATSQTWPGEILVCLVLASCRVETSVPRRTPARHSAPSDAGVVVFRDYPLSVSPCLFDCARAYQRCRGATPECEAFDRLTAASSSGDPQAFHELWRQLSVRASVCIAACGDPHTLCGRRCFDGVDAGLLPLR
jgi:hypothetical protein